MCPAVVLMSRLPVAGATKTRLMPMLSGQQCADFHRACLGDISRAITDSGFPAYLYYAAEPGHINNWTKEQMAEIWGAGIAGQGGLIFRPQCQGDLGERLRQAAREVLDRHEAVLLVGGDMPDMEGRILQQAGEKLEQVDVVIGPAADGGYYLLGVKRDHPQLFHDIPWGGDQVLAVTMRRSEETGLSCARLECGADIDDWEGLVSFRDRCRERGEGAGHLLSYAFVEQVIRETERKRKGERFDEQAGEGNSSQLLGW